ncbi:PREDICTED: uncharacterized protein LOC108782548 [Cyphomyrmex costatus]|uniref:uncharacterized protein LOC108782548 n=1 Tax=Cyphomyrmex costatus TaxID=456900 RepID=UPI0008523B00|nr:PREDICTED: uncharacterized protein LOC108782548 [Cyphomyrmex costatus]
MVNKLNGTQIDFNYSLISLDVVSLFTNIPIDKAIDSIEGKWNHIKDKIKITKEEFLIAVNLVLNSTFFSFDGCFYRQNFGIPMGSPLSPIIADLVTRDLEDEALNKLTTQPLFYYRYVDDIIMAIPKNIIDQTLNAFNSFHERLQFTVEIGGDRISFLDIELVNHDSVLKFNVYRKPTSSGRFLNFYSSHPISQKKGIILSMVDRTYLLSHPRYHQENLSYIIETLLNNDYPMDFIFNTINVRFRYLMSGKNKLVDVNGDSSTYLQPWYVIPFIPSISKGFKRISKIFDTKLVFKSFNKLDKFIRAQKDTLPKEQNKNVIYKIACNSCDATYVGQTGRRLKTRIAELKNHINHKTDTHSVITEHRLKCNHDFKWDDIKILDCERCLNRRLVSEYIHIHLQNKGLNRQNDTDGLHHNYKVILNEI